MLAVRYQLLQSLSFPVSSCPTSSACLGDTTTSLLPLSSLPLSIPLFSPSAGSLLSDPDSPSRSPRCLSVCYGPLVAAAVKGYLTRRLLHTERVGQLLCTIKDTQQFLQSFQPQSPGRDSRQDLVLQERVTLQTGETGSTRGKSSLSAATQKALERKRGVMMRKTAERQRGTGAGVVAGQKGPLAGAEGERGTGAGVVAGQKGPLAGAEGERGTGAGVVAGQKGPLAGAEGERGTGAGVVAGQKGPLAGAERQRGAGVVAGQKGPLAGAEGDVVKRMRGSFRPNPQRVPKTTQSRRSR
ncbi:uncharacterized protein LOC135534941 isoform X2 [Oncorhynchus masou masou]|uniref:uncharacterized protein LOC135534941 isoform X2 n=1 Tax=Oncorhynchus masou masou TaxID=90313 RepID=UPI0031835550